MTVPLPPLPKRVQALVQASSLPLVVVAADGSVWHCSLVAKQIARFTPGSSLMTWVHPDHQGILSSALTDAPQNFFLDINLGAPTEWRHCSVMGRRLLRDPGIWVLSFVDRTEQYEHRRRLEAFRSAGQQQFSLFEWTYLVDAQSYELSPGAHALLFGPEAPYLHNLSPVADHLGISPDDAARINECRQYAIEHETTFHAEYRVIWPDDSAHYIGSLGAFLRDINDRPTLVGYLVDLTETYARNEAAREAKRLKSLALMAGGVGHDFNNKLAVIMGCLSLLEADDGGPTVADPTGLIDRALQAAQEAGDLARQLLHLARNAPAQREPVAPQSLLEPIRGWMALHPRHQFVFEIVEPLWSLHGDRVGLQQVVDNLVRNALEAMPDGGILRLVVQNASAVGGRPEVELCVADSGPGVPVADRDGLFDPFYTTKSWGNGLGLATVQAIVKQHGGTVHVETAPEGGALFRVRLPGYPAAPTLLNTSPPEPARKFAGRVLVIDDMPDVLTMTATLVQSLGLTVQTAASGADALELLRSTPCDVILLDWILGVPLTGQTTYDRLRAAYPDLPVIITTGYADAPLPNEALVLAKPFNRQQLADAVAPFVRHRLERAAGNR